MNRHRMGIIWYPHFGQAVEIMSEDLAVRGQRKAQEQRDADSDGVDRGPVSEKLGASHISKRVRR